MTVPSKTAGPSSLPAQKAPPSSFDGIDTPSSEKISTCVHCGFCLPTCPTYLLWNEEMDSPRGRIHLMRAAADGRTQIDPTFVAHMDACLGCLACVTACPSGVEYAPLIEKTRGQIERRYPRPAQERLLRRALFLLLPYPGRLRAVFAPLLVLRPAIQAVANGPLGRALPATIRAMLALAPPVSWAGLTSDTPAVTPATGSRRLTLGFLTGCIQRVGFRQVNDATVRVLTAEGCDVHAPNDQGCCGALALHVGRLDDARAFARRLIETFERADREAGAGRAGANPAVGASEPLASSDSPRSGLDRIVVNAAGCGSAMKEYGDLLADDPAWASRARAFSARVRDVSEVLTELGEPRAPRHPIRAKVAYHDACHLCHAQGLRAEPRAMLSAIPGIEVVSAAEAEICCGSAGIYNVVQPEPAAALGARKAAHLDALAPDIVATGNPGCTLQIQSAARARGARWPVVHPIELVDRSIRGERGPA